MLQTHSLLNIYLISICKKRRDFDIVLFYFKCWISIGYVEIDFDFNFLYTISIKVWNIFEKEDVYICIERGEEVVNSKLGTLV